MNGTLAAIGRPLAVSPLCSRIVGIFYTIEWREAHATVNRLKTSNSYLGTDFASCFRHADSGMLLGGN
jgi:hypothetical protein